MKENLMMNLEELTLDELIVIDGGSEAYNAGYEIGKGIRKGLEAIALVIALL